MFRKNVASQVIHFQGVDSSTGGIKSGVTWTVRRCIDGTFAAATGTVTEDSTNGWYKFVMSQADTNGNNIGFNFTGTGAIPQTVNIVTTAANPTDGVRLGLTALPNAAADAAGGLPISDAGGLDLDGLNTNVSSILTDTAEIGAAGAGLTNINLPNQTMDIVGNITGNLSGSVGSVTGAVGSVTGNVGGNVTGSVGSVVGAVGSVTGAVGSVTGNVGGNVTGSIGSLGAQAKLDVNAEADTAISDAALATAANLATVAGYVDTEVAAIKSKTDQLIFTKANELDVNLQSVNGVTVNGDGSGTPMGV